MKTITKIKEHPENTITEKPENTITEMSENTIIEDMYEISKIEDLFENARKQTENTQLPHGHKERFLKKLEAKQGFWQKLKLWLNNPAAGKKAAWVLAPALCAIAAIMAVYGLNNASNIQKMESDCINNLKSYGMQLAEESKNVSPEDRKDVQYSISSILNEEDGMLALQLPDNMPKKEKQRIIKEYYNQKMEGLKKIKMFIAMNNEKDE